MVACPQTLFFEIPTHGVTPRYTIGGLTDPLEEKKGPLWKRLSLRRASKMDLTKVTWKKMDDVALKSLATGAAQFDDICFLWPNGTCLGKGVPRERALALRGRVKAAIRGFTGDREKPSLVTLLQLSPAEKARYPRPLEMYDVLHQGREVPTTLSPKHIGRSVRFHGMERSLLQGIRGEIPEKRIPTKRYFTSFDFRQALFLGTCPRTKESYFINPIFPNRLQKLSALKRMLGEERLALVKQTAIIPREENLVVPKGVVRFTIASLATDLFYRPHSGPATLHRLENHLTMVTTHSQCLNITCHDLYRLREPLKGIKMLQLEIETSRGTREVLLPPHLHQRFITFFTQTDYSRVNCGTFWEHMKHGALVRDLARDDTLRPGDFIRMTKYGYRRYKTSLAGYYNLRASEYHYMMYVGEGLYLSRFGTTKGMKAVTLRDAMKWYPYFHHKKMRIVSKA